MHPELFHIFGWAVRSYGFMLALSFGLGALLAAVRARRAGLDPRMSLDLSILITLGALIVSRLYYAVLYPESFPNGLLSSLDLLRIRPDQAGGFSMIGGLLGGILAVIAYTRLRRIPFLRYADTIAPSVALGVFLTRIGCFLNGCCFGKEFDGPWAVSFPPGVPAGRFQAEVQAAGLHPSQLYQSLGGLLLLIFLLAAGRQLSRWEGLQFYLLVVVYAVLRFGVELTRHYEPEKMVGLLTQNQVVCVVLFALFGGLALRALRTEPRTALA